MLTSDTIGMARGTKERCRLSFAHRKPGSWLVVPRVDLDGALKLECLIEMFGGFGCGVTLFERELAQFI